MSEELKRKLHEYEVNPPEASWKKISDALEEEINADFPRKLFNAAVTPPIDTWNKIIATLETVTNEYPEKLYHLEVAPPTASWDKISTALDQTEMAPVITPKKKIIPFFRYAAAACIIAIIAFVAIQFLNRNSIDHSIAGTTISPRNSNQPIVPDSQKIATEQAPIISNNLPKEGSGLKRTNDISREKNPLQQAAYMTQMVTPVVAGYNALQGGCFQEAVLRGSVPGNCATISEADPYLMFINPDGYLIRISKKLAETLGCIYANGNSDQLNQCEDQIKKWREKIAQSPASSSTDNFMDVLDIIKSVKD